MSGAPEICLADCSENKDYASSGRSEGARMQAKAHLKLVTPTGKKRAVTPQRRPNSEYRKREHLTPAEVAKLIEAARGNRYGQRDATMVLVAYRHGFRASEIVDSPLTSSGPKCTSGAPRMASRPHTRFV